MALLIENGQIDVWQSKVLARIPDDVAEVVICIDLERGNNVDKDAGIGSWIWELYHRSSLQSSSRSLRRIDLERRILGRTLRPSTSDGTRPADLVDWLASEIDEEDLGLDVALDFTRSYSADLHSIPTRLGVWRHEVAFVDARVGDSGFSKFDNPPVMELSLVRTVPQTGHRTIMSRGWVHGDKKSLAASVDHALFSMADFTRTALTSVRLSGGLPASERRVSSTVSFPDQSMLSFVVRSIWHRLLWAVDRLIRQDQWHVGIVDEPIQEIFRKGALPSATWLPNPRGRYLADPFAIPESDTILVEDFDHATQRGRIAVIDMSSSSDLPPRPSHILNGEGHMSYPFLFRSEGQIYCLPETSDQRRAILYRAVNWPHSWTTHAVIAEGLAATDSTIVHHAGKWWMFCTDDEAGGSSHLHIYYASQLEGPWQGHLLNPVKVDVRSARPAGTPFFSGGRLIRPAQQHSKGYGSGVVFNVVEKLSSNEFFESVVSAVDPPAHGSYRHGIHTLSAWGSRTLIDGKRRTFSAASIYGHLRSRLFRNTH